MELMSMPDLNKRQVGLILLITFVATIVGAVISPQYLRPIGITYMIGILLFFTISFILLAISDRWRDRYGKDKFITKAMPGSMLLAAALLLAWVVFYAVATTIADINSLEIEGARMFIRMEDLNLYTTFLFERLGTLDFILIALILFLLGGYHTVSRSEERRAIVGFITGLVVFVFIIQSMSEVLTIAGRGFMDSVAALSILVILPALAIFIFGGFSFGLISKYGLKTHGTRLIDSVYKKRMVFTILIPSCLSNSTSAIDFFSL